MNWRDENSLKNFLISWWSESRIITSDSNLIQNITRETTEVEKKEMDQDFRRIPELMALLEGDMYF